MQNLDKFFRNPSDYIGLVVSHVEECLSIKMSSHYKRKPEELNGLEVTYRCGDCNTMDEFSNDGRKKHEIEIFFIVTVSMADDKFDELALDVCSRIEREFVSNLFEHPDVLEEPHFIQSDPVAFNAENGYFMRAISIRQVIRMGPVDEVYGEIGGAELDGFNQESSGASE
ncbi:hypothetical protein [Vibrio anguillarum]|uniref:hypothetical protein n=1 Tax=Vibrio anguillarum TaxID=55601 RepID=UPI00097E3515|nr:hypothetical protein [Vibrio anguillarum]AQM21486.1 hypothetical protein PN51_16940 [Vibrio anguillarum]AUB86145.1 hypothetical protein CKY00_02200 [Vibrio anguillarum]AUB89583.1 hypothetical protein CKX99_02200 [Vibrio anguillarum]AUB93025.1 hypothetical protein CK210_02200 [Vibrio anguillarum]AUB96457.1 hypothetical protein CK209_02200 [Vibrio anguillarum]